MVAVVVDAAIGIGQLEIPPKRKIRRDLRGWHIGKSKGRITLPEIWSGDGGGVISIVWRVAVAIFGGIFRYAGGGEKIRADVKTSIGVDGAGNRQSGGWMELEIVHKKHCIRPGVIEFLFKNTPDFRRHAPGGGWHADVHRGQVEIAVLPFISSICGRRRGGRGKGNIV